MAAGGGGGAARHAWSLRPRSDTASLGFSRGMPVLLHAASTMKLTSEALRAAAMLSGCHGGYIAVPDSALSKSGRVASRADSSEVRSGAAWLQAASRPLMRETKLREDEEREKEGRS